jgi:hypothetical protein
MTIPLTGSQSMFVRQGHLGGTLNYINSGRGSNFLTHVDNTIADYQTTDTDAITNLVPQATLWQTSQELFTEFLNDIGVGTILDMVYDDTKLNNITLASGLAELIRQMQVSGDSVNQPTVSAAVTYGNGVISNNGTGTAVVSVLNGYGLQLDYAFAENFRLICTNDAQTGTATAGNEVFTITSQALETIPTFYTWPVGSGATGTITCVNSVQSQSATTNLLNNSGFETFTANTPNQWTAVTGTAGTDFQAGGSGNAFTGTNCLEVVGTGTAVTLNQTFGNSGGTLIVPEPETPYILSFWVKTSATPAAGVVTMKLVNGSNTVINDDQGNANSTAFSLTAVSTTYLHKSCVFRLPRVLPSVINLQILESTDITSGKNFFIDEMVLTPAYQLYDGGPYVAITAGNVNFIQSDQINLAISNNYAGGFQQLFQRFFDMQSLGLMLPSSVSPTISDSLIT